MVESYHMATFQQRRDPVRLLWRRLSMVALCIAIIAVGKGVWSLYIKEQASRELKAEAIVARDSLQRREAELRTEIANLKSVRGIEAELRERYDVAAEGEGVIVIIEPPPAPQPPAPTRMQRFTSWFTW